MNKKLRSIFAFALVAVTAGAALAAPGLTVRQLEHKAKNGDAESMYQLGQCYFDGDTVKANYRQAAVWFLKAHDKGNAEGTVGLADCYANGLGGNYSFAEAFKLYSEASDAENVKGLYGVGYCYDFGLGVRADYNKASRSYSAAAEQGSIEAMCGLARLYSSARTAFPDNNSSRRWFNAAWEAWESSESPNLDGVIFEMVKSSGHGAEAFEKISGTLGSVKQADLSGHDLYTLARAYELEGSDPDMAASLMDKAAEKGYINARLAKAAAIIQNDSAASAYSEFKDIYEQVGSREALSAMADIAGQLVRQGDNQYLQDFLKFNQELMKGGDFNAMARLAGYYAFSGDTREYSDIIHKAADMGDGEACLQLSELYRTGSCAVQGLTADVDLDKAYKYLSALCEEMLPMNYANADMRAPFCTLGNMYYYGKGCSVNYPKAEKWYRASASIPGGNIEADFRLGQMLFKGQGSTGDRDEGIELLRKVLSSDLDDKHPFKLTSKQLLRSVK
ncbi:MAG: sel1 repeat family protein [bacterium]|nr:sel1 repeat family protein [bacterium]